MKAVGEARKHATAPSYFLSLAAWMTIITIK
jgi:hypothetical protein